MLSDRTHEACGTGGPQVPPLSTHCLGSVSAAVSRGHGSSTPPSAVGGQGLGTDMSPGRDCRFRATCSQSLRSHPKGWEEISEAPEEAGRESWMLVAS